MHRLVPLVSAKGEYAKKNLAYFSSICDEKDIVIFDRGYPSRGMIAALTGMGCKNLSSQGKYGIIEER